MVAEINQMIGYWLYGCTLSITRAEGEVVYTYKVDLTEVKRPL